MSPLACAVAKKRYGLANQQRSECGGSVAVNVSLVTLLVRCTVPARKGVLIYPKLCHSEGRSHVGGGGGRKGPTTSFSRTEPVPCSDAMQCVSRTQRLRICDAPMSGRKRAIHCVVRMYKLRQTVGQFHLVRIRQYVFL
jgi:hypothetical protein